MLLAQSRVNAIARSLHRIGALLFQIVPRRVKFSPIPTWMAINVDWLRHATVVYHFEKLGTAKSDVSGRALNVHGARRICEMVLELIANHSRTPVTNNNNLWKDILEISRLDGADVDRNTETPFRQPLRSRLRHR
jgi:hypothetical protein